MQKAENNIEELRAEGDGVLDSDQEELIKSATAKNTRGEFS